VSGHAKYAVVQRGLQTTILVTSGTRRIPSVSCDALSCLGTATFDTCVRCAACCFKELPGPGQTVIGQRWQRHGGKPSDGQARLLPGAGRLRPCRAGQPGVRTAMLVHMLESTQCDMHLQPYGPAVCEMPSTNMMPLFWFHYGSCNRLLLGCRSTQEFNQGDVYVVRYRVIRGLVADNVVQLV
jgi:DNA replication complex GINS protein SLD5 C-terminus